MCGICGVVNANQDRRAAVAAMTADLERRGPDDGGTWRDPRANTTLGFRRLAIIDLSPAGAQPMVSADGEDVVVFNGEVYNHADLRRDLEATGVGFRSRSDTEVLLEALRHWGLADTLPRLRGMFAFAWYRPISGRLVLARDHVGIKPLYVAEEPGGPGVAFSSRYDSLFRTGWLDLDAFDPEVLAAYLHHRRVPAPAALHRGARQVAPGGYLIAGRDGVEEDGRWYTLEPVEPDLRGEEAVDAVAEALEASVRRHLVSDVPVGAFLSSGIDSPLVAGTATRLATEPLRSFTVSVAGWAGDEGPGAARLAGLLGLDHREGPMPEATAEDLADVVAALHEPVNDLSLLPTMAVSRFARREVTVALSGDGGDELFFGYARPWSVDAHRWLWRLPRWARRAPMGVLSRAGRLRTWAALHQDPVAYYAAMHRAADLSAVDAVAPDLVGRAPSPFRPLTGLGRRALADFGRSADVDVQLNRILTKVDTASMHHSLEVRVPLLDPDVIATSLRIDPAWTLSQPATKPVLRTLLGRLVPASATLETKRGFTIPLAEWLRIGMAPVVEETLLGGELWPSGVFDRDAIGRVWAEHREGRPRTILLWGLLSLQWWARRVSAMP